MEGDLPLANLTQREAAIAEEAYRRGFKSALRLFAWWNNGVQYVGCGVMTLKTAEAEADTMIGAFSGGGTGH